MGCGHAPTVAEASDRAGRTASLADGVGSLRYVSAAREKVLVHLGVRSVRDLLLHVPHRYLDFTDVAPIERVAVGDEATVVARVDKVTLKRPRPRMQIVELFAMDETGVLQVTFFKQPWIADQVHPGDMVALSGKVTFGYGFKQMKAPFYEVLGSADEASSYQRVLPVHPVGEGITAAWMRRIVSAALADAGDVCDWVPASLVCRHGLMTFARALREVHFPASLDAAEAARRRLAYDELLSLQLALLARRRIDLAGIEPTCHVTDGPCKRALVSSLPFALTCEQQEATQQVLHDMAAPRVMNRLLLGDVGTGKTAVAAVALAAVADSGTQAAVMAPTSVLARQYAEKVGPLLDSAGIAWALITGATPTPEREQATSRIADGSLTVCFGTTALLSGDVTFAHLTLVIVDEQHRFGVDQRAALREKGAGADMLTMTATPIPRTLALSVYGDLDCSRIRHRPRAGAGISTTVITPENVDMAYSAIRAATDAGQQAYVVCPLVDDADEGDELDDVPEADVISGGHPRSVASTSQELSRIFGDLTVESLTGRMSAAEKDDVMARFREGSIDLLVCTTVIEVGVDVPNATVMLVWDSDRFGLATLHQLRGRVGRGDVPGRVFMASAARKGTPARTRLAALEATSDGLELAELDLKLRREGEVLGYRQSGGVTLNLVDLAADSDLVEAAHADALEVTDADPALSSPENVPMAIEARDRFGAYFEEARGA